MMKRGYTYTFSLSQNSFLEEGLNLRFLHTTPTQSTL